MAKFLYKNKYKKFKELSCGDLFIATSPKNPENPALYMVVREAFRVYKLHLQSGILFPPLDEDFQVNLVTESSLQITIRGV